MDLNSRYIEYMYRFYDTILDDMDRKVLRQKAVLLRRQGRTYGEISRILGKIPKGTLSFWLHDVQLPLRGQRRRNRAVARQLGHARERAVHARSVLRREYFDALKANNMHLVMHMGNKEVAKLLLAMLYAAEGAKGKNTASLVFGNSDTRIIRIFLSLLRTCYQLDERKFRCTVQCRADMHSKTLERFWSRVTKIPLQQFYATSIDPRSIGKKSNKPAYKGVCRVQYFSAELFHDLMTVFELVSEKAS